MLVLLLAVCASARAQQPATDRLVTTGHLTVDGRDAAYQVRHLPVSSFPDLPVVVAGELIDMGCLIPQTYQARRPENVVHASLERAGSSDWAVLCSSGGEVSLLVFFASNPVRHMRLATAAETERLQKHPGTDLLGFNWGIDPASPDKVHQAQIGLSPRPRKPDHDALADSIVDGKTIYRFYAGGAWVLLDMPD